MRSYRPMRLGAILDPQLRREMQPVDDWLRDLSSQQARIVTMPQGTPTIVTNPTTGVESGAYLYLPGRPTEQQSVGPVSFQALPLPYSVGTVPTVETAVSLRATTSDGGPQPARVFFFIQGGRTGATLGAQKRYWTFPSFTEINQGPTVGHHVFVDTSDFQTLTKKTFDNDNRYQMEDTVAGAGWLNAAHDRTLQFAWGGSYPFGGGAVVTPTTLTGIIPSLQIPALDVKDNGSGVRDRSHVFPVVKRAHTFSSSSGAPFESGGVLFGSSTGRELYPMFTSVQGTLAAPTDGSFPVWHPTVTQSCTFTLSSPIVTMATTAGIQIGMRMKEVITNYALAEDTHVLSVDSPTQITMSQNWPSSNLVRTIDFFGMSWSDTATGISLGAGTLTDYLYLPGRVSGQHIGSGTAPTGGALGDVSTYGRIVVGTSSAEADAYVTGTKITTKSDLDITSGGTQIANNFHAFLTGSGAASGTIVGLELDISGGSGATSGTYNVNGLTMSVSPTVPSGVTFSAMGMRFNNAPSGAGTFSLLIGAQFNVFGSGTVGSSATTIVGVQGGVNNLATVVTNLIGVQATNSGGTISGAVTQATAFDVGSTFANDTDVVTWSGLRISTGITAAIANKWALDLTNTSTNMGSRIAHKMGLGWNPATVSAITARVMLAAGTATAGTAPIKFQSGTLLTAAEAGTIEFNTDDFYAGITTGPARKKFVLDDGTALTSGRVPFATTNGRLTDDADMTFATDTLTVTKIAGTNFTGSLQFNQGVNLILATATGTKIGTTISQMLAFWGSTPTIQLTTSVPAGTFTANTSGIVDDSATFDGYTLGQIVRALRTMGLLA